MSEDTSAESTRAAGVRAGARPGARAADRSDEPPREKDDARRDTDKDRTPPESKDDRTTADEPRTPAEERDGPISEKDALRSLTEAGAHGDAERSEALRAGAIADEIARRLNADASGTRIGTLALFNETVSFGGGLHTGAGRGTERRPGGASLLALDTTEVADHTDLYVQPEGYEDAVEVLRERRLLVLTGPPGSGRTAAAVNLLEEALAIDGGGGGGCHRLLVPSQVLEPGWEPPVKHSGYLAVLEDGPAGVRRFTTVSGSRGDLGPAQWAAVAAALRDAGSLLVLTGGHDLEVLAAGPGGDHLAHHPLTPLDPVAVVERRVLGHGGGADAYADLHALLERTGAAAALREQPAARHAARLASVISAHGDIAAEVARLRDPSEQVRAWFDRYREPEPVAFALAAAVLEGSGYLTVADAAVALRAALTEPAAAPPDLRFGDLLGHEQQWIRLELPDTDSLLAGPPRVYFRNALLGQVILAYAWTVLDGRRGAVLDWLRRLLTHPDLEVRARASVAAGVLVLADPQHAVHRFLASWAGSTSWPLRQAAATALGVAGSRPETADPVWELLHHWARGDASAQQRRLAGTAANAVGGLLGRSAPDRAVAVLRAALDRGDDWGTLPSVAWGGVHLLHQGEVVTLLDAYLEWSEPQDLSPMVVKTLSAFVFAVSRPYEQPLVTAEDDGGDDADAGRGGGRGGGGKRVPGVPVLLTELPRHHDRLAELWARALARKPVQDTALEALRAWIDDHADDSPGALDAIGRLLTAVARRPGRHRERLEWWLEKWARDRDHPSANAARLLREFDRGGR